MPAVRRQPRVADQRLAHKRQMAVPFGHPAKAQRCNVGAAVGEKRHAGFRFADFGDRRRKLRMETTGRSAISFCVAFWPTATRSIRSASREQRRARQAPGGDFRLVGRQRIDDLERRVMAERQRLGERQPHFRRGVVEQQRQRRFGRAAVLEREVGVDIGARQRACCRCARSTPWPCTSISKNAKQPSACLHPLPPIACGPMKT